jgi:hypothetical protein
MYTEQSADIGGISPIKEEGPKLSPIKEEKSPERPGVYIPGSKE